MMKRRSVYFSLMVLSGAFVVLGCTRTVHVEVPDSFHGHVNIACGDVVSENDSTIRIPVNGELSGIRCPAREGHLIVTRANGLPVDVHAGWITTGDGIVRGITFDVQ